ncbi:MAG: thiopurine S-methyltransferase [Kofleriaceae bacterium]|nr:thiopurine S-methyltransferase [Kofleriaceae bacterium]
MDPAFWNARWQEGRIGFHEGVPNVFLAKYGDRLADKRRILVPLCGKTEDLAYLASRGHEVVGIELVEDAVRQFFAEHQTTPAIEKRGPFTAYTSGPITIFAGDFFASTRETVGEIDAIYDRAALIALPPPLRDRYVPHLRQIAATARRELLVVVEYPDGSFEGPPFSVDDAEVRRRFADASIEELETAPEPRGRANGQMMERCYDLRY